MRQLPVIAAGVLAIYRLVAIHRLLVIVAILALPCAAQSPSKPADAALHPVVYSTLETGFEVADHLLVDVDGEAGDELFALGSSGEVRLWMHAGTTRGLDPKSLGELVLSDPRHSLVALAHILGGEKAAQIVVASPRGVELYRQHAGGGFAGEPIALLPKSRFRLRVGLPRLADIVQDVNGDGRDDLVLPAGDTLEIWIQQAARTGSGGETPLAPDFKRVAQVHVEVSRSQSTDAGELSDTLAAAFTIPGLVMRDVNGDGRDDLLVSDGDVRAFHLVRADGSIPESPDVTVDLSIFRDTTPAATLAPGRTLAGGDETRYESKDLDNDGIPDYVIAHRRKVWVFHGTKDGPQFKAPSTVLKAADDVTALLLVNLDGDPYPDLLLFKVLVPTVADLLRALVSEWSIDVDAAGYKSKSGRAFETSPTWKSTIEVRLPAILKLAKNPEKFVKRFEDVGKKFRSPVEGDLDGDGASDVALRSEDRAFLDVWRARAAQDLRQGDDALVRKLLFEDENKTWDIDRLVTFIGTYAERRIELITGGRAAEARIPLRDPATAHLEVITPGDIQGDKRVQLVLRYRDWAHGGMDVFDVVGVE